ncbi:unnamed protein product [Peniophora sp. CBMAI 1063]|nr:unnamed protein product [Peniophora sp. CBMAI 1063]
MPSLRRSNTSTAVARAGAAPYATAAALSWSSSSSSSTRTATQHRRVSDPTQTKSRRVLADIDWWLVHDGQVDADTALSEDEGLDENLEAANEAARPPMAVASLPRAASLEPEWLRRVRDGDSDGATHPRLPWLQVRTPLRRVASDSYSVRSASSSSSLESSPEPMTPILTPRDSLSFFDHMPCPASPPSKKRESTLSLVGSTAVAEGDDLFNGILKLDRLETACAAIF